MNIVIQAPHHWPIPTPAHTGHIVILDLAIALEKLGHFVTLCAPSGTEFTHVAPMMCGMGQSTPTATAAEVTALHDHKALFDAADIIHDWSVEKHAAEWYPDKSVSTIMSGNTQFPRHGRNVVTWTNEARERALRGASDYEGTEFTQWHSVSRALRDARVVAGGVDTEFWRPLRCMRCLGRGKYDVVSTAEAKKDCPCDLCKGTGNAAKEDWILWAGRWHEARGYQLAIDMAKATSDVQFVFAGEHPDDATNEHQKRCAHEAHARAAGAPNIDWFWLPKENHREALREVYSRARAYLYTPRLREPFGLQQAEALACGTPIVGIRIGSVPEVIDHGVTGLVVEPAFLASACRKIEAIDPARCREEAVRRFDRSVMAKAYVERYEECLRGGWG